MVSPSYPSASLYVGNLAPEVSESNLFEIFNAIGPVASIRVCRDAITRRSLGYAYVNFHMLQDAERAMEQLNSTVIKTKSCRIMWSQRDPSLRKSGVGNIFIKNLHPSIDHRALFDTFSTFGTILSCKVATDENGLSKGYGFVHYENQEQADKAISKVNGMMIQNQQVYVGRFIPKKERMKDREAQEFTNVYVKNLPENFSQEQLQHLFSPFGTITSLVLAPSPIKGKTFGFVNFGNSVDAKRAIVALNDSFVDSQQIYVGRAQKRSERELELRQKYEQLKIELANKYQGVNLYIKNLDDDIDDNKLHELFSPFGSITSAKVMKNERDASKGFGFVCYTAPEEAAKAMTEMNGRIVGTKPLYVALAQRKEVRTAQVQQQKMKRTFPSLAGSPAPPLYQNLPMFFQASQQPSNLPQQFMYHPLVQRPARNWGQASQPQYQSIPNYVIPNQRQMRQNMRGTPNRTRYTAHGSRDPPNVPHPPAQMLAPVPEQEPLTMQTLMQIPADQHSLIIGEKLYPLISQVQPERAAKITGMLLDEKLSSSGGVEELLHLLTDSAALNDKISEALDVLEANGQDGIEEKRYS